MYLIIWMRVWHCCNAEMKSHNVFFVWIFCILNYVLLFIGSVQNVLFEIHFCVYLWLWEIRLIKGVHQCAVFLIKFMYSCIQIEKQELKIWSWPWHDNTLKKMKSNKSILHSIWKSIWIRWIYVHQSHIKLQTNSYFMFGCVMLVKERKCVLRLGLSIKGPDSVTFLMKSVLEEKILYCITFVQLLQEVEEKVHTTTA